MHFAYPPRKTSHPPPYEIRNPRSFSLSYTRRKQLQAGAIVLLTAFLLIFGLSHFFGPPSEGERIPPGTPDVVIVTVLDEQNLSPAYIEKIQENRRSYAARHGYTTFFPNVNDYSFGDFPRSWALVPALRHAMTAHPHSTYFFALSPHALIMSPSIDLHAHILNPKKLETLMLREKPVVPPDSVIKTFGNLKGDRADLIITQDGEGLCQGSFILRRGEWARFFLDTWFDPLYRSYNFQKAEAHALEHIVQWHPTILSKLALIPQRLLNTYNVEIASRGGEQAMYKDGDFIVRLVGCESDPSRNCEAEFDAWKGKVKGS